MDLHALLVDLGLTPGEARLYLCLRDAPLARVPTLARDADMSRPRAYDVAASLVRRGLAEERNGLYKRFEAVPLQQAISRLLVAQHERLLELEARAKEVVGEVVVADAAPVEPAESGFTSN